MIKLSPLVIRTAIIAGVIFFAAVAVWRLYLPGLYYDEVLFVPPAAVLFDDCSLPAGIFVRLGCVPILLQPPYLGSLKALLYAGVFSVFPVNAISVRLPMIIVFFVAIWLFAAFWRRRLHGWLGLAFLLLLLTDVNAIIHARIDWGPFVLAAVFKMLVVCLAISWIETRNPWRAVQLVAAILIGVFDKLNFLWIVAAMAIAGPAVYWRQILEGLKALTKWSWAVIAALTLFGLVWFVAGILPIIRSSGTGQTFDLASQFGRVWHVLHLMFNAGPYEFFYRQPWPGLTTNFDVFVASMVGGLVVFAALYPMRRRFGETDRINQLAGWCSFTTILLVLIVLAMIATKEVGGTHHTVVVTQLWQLQLVTLLGTVIELTRRLFTANRAWLPTSVTALTSVVLIFVLLSNLQSGRYWLEAYDYRKPGNPNFSPLIYELAEYVNASPDIPVVTVDWGLGNNLTSLAPNGQRKRIRDYWPMFMGISEGDENSVKALKINLDGATEALFVMRDEEQSTFPAAKQGFDRVVLDTPECRSGWREFVDYSGAVQYLVAKLPTQCIADKI